MKLQFGKVEHGWLPMTLELDGGETLAFDLSYLPYDFIGELVAALAGVLDGPGEYVARMCEEPTEHEWRFRAFDASAVTFEIVTWFDGPAGKGEIVARAWVRRSTSCFRCGVGCASWPAGRRRKAGARTGARHSPSKRSTG